MRQLEAKQSTLLSHCFDIFYSENVTVDTSCTVRTLRKFAEVVNNLNTSLRVTLSHEDTAKCCNNLSSQSRVEINKKEFILIVVYLMCC